jgi:hypothetical protein
VARVDKASPKAGGSRAPLAAAWSSNDIGKLYAVGLNASGQVVKGSGNSGIVGVLVLTKAYPAGEVVDIMFNGHIVEFGPTAGTPGSDFGTPGTAYYGKADGNIVAAEDASEGDVYIGFTVHGRRLVVNVSRGAIPPEV